MKKFIAIAIVLILSTFSFFFFPKKSKFYISQLKNPVRIDYDYFGIPHIMAQDSKDLYFTLGHTVARERLFQIDIQRRLANGELSEIFGSKTIEIDKLSRTLGFRKIAKAYFKNYPLSQNPKMQIAIDSFLAGINQYIREDHFSLEYTLLNIAPRPFNRLDIMAFAGYMALTFSDAFKTDLHLSNLAKILPEELFNFLRLDNKNLSMRPTNIPEITQYLNPLLEEMSTYSSPLIGSNAWVTTKNKSPSGIPLLANDPHIKYGLPGIWFEAHLNSPTFEIYGHFLPLFPFAVLGHKNSYGWAMTMALIDDMTFYKEKINGNEYWYNGKFHPIITRSELIKIKDQPSLALTIQETIHGPLLSFLPSGKNISVQWTFADKKNDLLTALFAMNNAQNLDHFQKSLNKIKGPSINILYADKKNIAWWLAGSIPDPMLKTPFDVVLPGTGEFDRNQFLPFHKNPRSINPKQNFIASANSSPSKKTLPGYFRSNDRFSKLDRTLARMNKPTLEDHKNLQTDVSVLPSSDILDLTYTSLTSTQKNFNSNETQFLNILREWNGESSTSSKGSTLYTLWNQNILNTILAHHLEPKNIKNTCKMPHIWKFYKKVLKDPLSLWWDDPNTAEKESMNTILYISMKKTLKKLGSDPANWSWNTYHTLTLKHPLGKEFPLNTLLNLGPKGISGGNQQINNQQHSFCNSTEVTAGPSTRRLIDFSNPSVSLGILPSGNSGNRLSSHYQDQFELFTKNKYRFQYLNNEFKVLKTIYLHPKKDSL